MLQVVLFFSGAIYSTIHRCLPNFGGTGSAPAWQATSHYLFQSCFKPLPLWHNEPGR